MKFTTQSSDLLKKLNTVAGALPSNAAIPIMEDFLFNLKDGELAISGTDLEVSVTTTMIVTGQKDGIIAVPAKIILETLKSLPSQPIDFEASETFGITVKSAHGTYKMAGEDGKDFPNVPNPENVDSVTLEMQTLSKGLLNTAFASSNDDLRPALTGVLFELGDEGLKMTATDSHKLAHVEFFGVVSDSKSTFIVPKKALSLLKNILPDTGDIKMAFNKTNAFFSYADVYVSCRLVDARYPDYKNILPQDNGKVLQIDRKGLLNSLKRIAIYSNKTTNQVVLNISPDSLTLSAQDLDYSNEASEQMPCTFSGENFKIGFNARFLVEMLSVLKCEDIVLKLSSPTKPGVIQPLAQAEHESITMLAMPVMLG